MEKKPLHLKTDEELTPADREELYRSEQWDWATERERFAEISDPVLYGPLPAHHIRMDQWHGATVRDHGKRPGSSIIEIAARRAITLGIIGGRLGKAQSPQIHAAITKAYDDAERRGEPAPNINDISAPVLKILRLGGVEASANRVKILARDPRHEGRRRPVGKRL